MGAMERAGGWMKAHICAFLRVRIKIKVKRRIKIKRKIKIKIMREGTPLGGWSREPVRTQ